MARKSKRPKRKSGARGKEGTNFADVVIRLIDAMYDLAQTGNIIGLIIFAIIAWAFYVTYKVPVGELQGALGGVGGFLASERFYIFPLTSVLAVSLITNVIQEKVYRRHIQDLTDHRRALVHGYEHGKLKSLDVHHTSDFDTEDPLEEKG
ncbi:MAG: hypothetical protein ABW168_10970 [Sedimenticola sp.]